MKAAAIVVNHNGGDDLPRCLAALLAQSVAVEIVLVDCASTDGSRRLAEAPPPGVRAVALPDNRGFAGGANAGLAALGAEVEVVGVFNPDCFARPDLFAVCLELLDREPGVGGVAPRLVRADGETLDSCGQVLTPWLLRVRDRGFGEPAAVAWGAPGRVLAACGAGMVYRRRVLEAAAVDGEVLPSAFFAFWEDLDLGWRVSNLGHEVRYEPRAVAVHRRAATAEPGRGRLLFRRPPALQAHILVNRWATFARNLHAVDFLVRLPVLLMVDAAMVALVVARRPAVARPLLAALPGVVRAWRQRRVLRQRPLRELA
jgi:GT2 family glycosyltransferase